MQFGGGARGTRTALVVVASGGLASAALLTSKPGAFVYIGASTLGAVALSAHLARRANNPLTGPTLALAGAILLLATSAGGLTSAPLPLLATACAYLLLGHAALQLVARHRRLRLGDLLVESALVSTAVGIVLHVAMTTVRAGSLRTPWGEAEGAFPEALVALDVALLVASFRGLRAPSAARGPLGYLHIAITLLLGAHLVRVVGLASGAPATTTSICLALAGIVALGAAAGHPAARLGPGLVTEEPAAFSPGHATVVTVALLAAPVLFTVQAARGMAVSTTIASGAVLSACILACYVVSLLRERAATEHEATHDSLTRLPNRTLLVDRLERSIAHARRSGGAVGLLFIDLDRFKEVNDTYGHADGDRLLQTVATRLVSCVRDEDTVARLSGDEFVILLPILNTPDEVLIVTKRLQEALGHPVTVAGERMLVTGSVGVAVFPGDGATAEEVLASADAAMYRAKERPGNTWEVFSPQLATQAQVRRRLEAGLLDGLGRDELVLHYQPIVDVASGRTAGAEALVRWNHPEKGFLLPGHFVPVAEQSDLIVMLGEKVLYDACTELRRWEDLGISDLFVTVNVSSRQFNHELVSTIAAALRTTGADPTRLVVELTESTVVDNLDAVAATLSELRAMGVRSAIDDFGTGYCGLRYLSTLPVASLKIDRSFIQGMTPSDAAIVGATIAMGHSLGLTIVAEGVETAEQHRFLAGQGCDRIQGYLLGKPMPADELVDRIWLERRPELAGAAHPEPGVQAEVGAGADTDVASLSS